MHNSKASAEMSFIFKGGEKNAAASISLKEQIQFKAFSHFCCSHVIQQMDETRCKVSVYTSQNI